MAIKMTPGLANYVLGFTDGKTFREALDGGFLDIYSGTRPTAASSAEAGTKLIEIRSTAGSSAATLSMCTAASVTGASLAKATGQIWSGIGLAAGTATWFRYYGPTKVTGASDSAIRFDGTVGTGAGNDLILSSTTIAVGAPLTIDSFKFKLPVA